MRFQKVKVQNSINDTDRQSNPIVSQCASAGTNLALLCRLHSEILLKCFKSIERFSFESRIAAHKKLVNSHKSRQSPRIVSTAFYSIFFCICCLFYSISWYRTLTARTGLLHGVNGPGARFPLMILNHTAKRHRCIRTNCYGYGYSDLSFVRISSETIPTNATQMFS